MKKLILVLLAFSLLLSSCDQKNKVDKTYYDNGLTFSLEKVTKHFLFYSEKKDKSCLKGLSISLESNFDRITTDLDCKIDFKTKVIIYPDIKTFHISTDLMHLDDNFIGTATKKEIKIVSPLNPGPKHYYSEFFILIQHEFSHTVLYNIGEDIPVWLSEGTAMLEAKQGNDDMISQIVAKNGIPSIKELESLDYFTSNYGHYYSYSLVKYIADNYGQDKLNLLIRHFSEIKATLGVDMEELWKNWSDYLKKEYN